MTDRADEIARFTRTGTVHSSGPHQAEIADLIRAYGDERAKGERERYTGVLKYAQSLADEEFGQEVSANDISRLADALRALKEKP